MPTLHAQQYRQYIRSDDGLMAPIGRADYAARKAALIERLIIRAAKRRASSEASANRASAILGMIPAGQPILVGHHSEKRHRGDLARVDSLYSKSSADAKDANRLESRIDSAESNRAISSDDPNCIERLRAKLVTYTTRQTMMKAANAAIKKNAKAGKGEQVAALVSIGFPQDQAAELVTADFCGRVGFPSYRLTNNGAEIRRIEKRIKSIENTAAVVAVLEDETIGEVKIAHRDNRIMMIFPGKPADAIRAKLKSNGFRWSPTSGAWQRLPGQWALHVAREIANEYGQRTASK